MPERKIRILVAHPGGRPRPPCMEAIPWILLVGLAVSTTSISYRTFHDFKPLPVAINLGLNTIRQYKHRICVSKIHAGNQRKIAQSCFFHHYLQQHSIVFCKIFGWSLPAGQTE